MPIADVVTFTVSLSAKLGKIHVLSNLVYTGISSVLNIYANYAKNTSLH